MTETKEISTCISTHHSLFLILAFFLCCCWWFFFFFCDDWLFEATWMDAASGLKMMFLAATDRDALSVSLLFIIIIFISFSLETLYPLTLLFLSLCLIHYK